MNMKQNKLSLNDVEWGEFKIIDIFEIIRGNAKNITKRDMEITKGIPLVSAKDNNNAVNGYVELIQDERVFANVLTTNNNGSVGFTFYHEYKFIATSDVTVLSPNKKLTKNQLLFTKKCIENNNLFKFRYGYKASNERLKRSKFLLPIQYNGNPNWQFMEDYIKQEQKDIAQKVIDYYEQKMLGTSFDLVGLEDVKWKEFYFNDVFRKIQRGKRLKKDDHIEGDIPYISSTSLNNGLDGFIGNKDNIRKFNNNLTLANSGSVGSCFYHNYEYIASDHVTSLTLENADKYIYLFMATIIKRLEKKYSFNREINDKRIKNEKFILPTDKFGNPNWEYMSKFMKNLEAENLEKALEYIYIYIWVSSFQGV